MEPEDLHFKDLFILIYRRQQKAYAITISKTDDKLRPRQDFPEIDQDDSVGQRPEKLILLRQSRPDLSYLSHIQPPKTSKWF
jgi:hypothetical protein